MQPPDPAEPQQPADAAAHEPLRQTPSAEIGGRKGLDPTRYGDWEKDGRCIDF